MCSRGFSSALVAPRGASADSLPVRRATSATRQQAAWVRMACVPPVPGGSPYKKQKQTACASLDQRAPAPPAAARSPSLRPAGVLVRRARRLERAAARTCRVGRSGRDQHLPPRVAAVRRTGADWILFFTAPRAWAKRCAATPRWLFRSVATADRSHAQPRNRRKEARYLELRRPGPQRLVVLACETGGRWGPETCGLVDRLVRLRAHRAPQALLALQRAEVVSASSVHAEFGSSVHAGPDRLCTRAFFAPDRLYTQCLLLCTRRDRGVDSCMFPCLSVV